MIRSHGSLPDQRSFLTYFLSLASLQAMPAHKPLS